MCTVLLEDIFMKGGDYVVYIMNSFIAPSKTL